MALFKYLSERDTTAKFKFRQYLFFYCQFGAKLPNLKTTSIYRQTSAENEYNFVFKIFRVD